MEEQPKRTLRERVRALLLYPGRPPLDGFERIARVVLGVYYAGGGLYHALDTLANSLWLGQVGLFVPFMLMGLAVGLTMAWMSWKGQLWAPVGLIGFSVFSTALFSLLALRFHQAPLPEDLVRFAFMLVTAAWSWLRHRALHGGPVRPMRIATFGMIAGLVALAPFAVNSRVVELKEAWANRGEFSDENRPVLASAGTAVAGIAFTTRDGATLALDTPGMLYVVDYVATWCSPCREEVPYLVELARDPAYRDRFRLVLVNGEEPDVLPRAHSLFKWDDVVVDHANWGERLGVSAFPTKVLIRDGKIVATFVGGSGDDAREKYARVIDEFAGAAPGAATPAPTANGAR